MSSVRFRVSPLLFLPAHGDFHLAPVARVSHLILYAAPPRIRRTDDYPAGWPLEMFEEILVGTETTWGTDAVADWVNPSAAKDEAYRRWFGHMQRLAASPGSAREMMAGLPDLDIREPRPVISFT